MSPDAESHAAPTVTRLTDEDATLIRLVGNALTLREAADVFGTSPENIRLIQSGQTHANAVTPVRPERLATLLTRLRDDCGLSDREIARLLATDNKTVAAWRRGTRIPRNPGVLAAHCIRILARWQEQQLVYTTVRLPRAVVADAQRLGNGNVSAGLRRMLGDAGADVWVAGRKAKHAVPSKQRVYDVSARVRALQTHLKWSQTRLAQEIGTSQTFVSAWLRGEQGTRRVEYVNRIAALEKEHGIAPRDSAARRLPAETNAVVPPLEPNDEEPSPFMRPPRMPLIEE